MTRRSTRSMPRPRRRDPIPVYGDRNDYADAELMAKRAAEMAPMLGFCPYCGGDVDEAKGKKHLPDCAVAPERRCPHDRFERNEHGVVVCVDCTRRQGS